MNKKIGFGVVLTCFLLLVVTSGLAAEVQTVAVIPFDDNVITSAEAIALSDILENRLAQYGNFELVERKKIENLMKELNFGTSDFVDQSTAVEAGRMLSAHWLILGSVSRLGNEYSINVKLVNTESGRIVTGASGDAKNIAGIKNDVEEIARTLSTYLLTEFNGSLDISGTVLMQNLEIHSLGANVGFVFSITKEVSAGVWGGAHMRNEDSKLKFMWGGKLLFGDPRKLAFSVNLGHLPSIGLVYKQFFVEVSPLMLLGNEGALGISVGYSVCN